MAELCPAAIALAGEIARRTAKDGGAALIVDYGHSRSAPGDTLQAVRHHRPEPALDAPGEADITAHVDFEALGRAAVEAGAAGYGPVAPGDFLRRLGIETRAAALRRAAPGHAAAVDAACRRLIAPAEMGTLFKALTITIPGLTVPAGFETATGPKKFSISDGGETR